MSLTAEFFEARQNALAKYNKSGYVEIEVFEKYYSLTQHQLFVAGYLDERSHSSTADVYDYHVSKKGRRYIKEIRKYDLLLIKPDKAINLANMVAKKCK